VSQLLVYSAYTKPASNAAVMIEVSQTRLHELIRSLLHKIVVEEDWYRRRYGDVDEAIRQGALNSAKDHYIAVGYFENRIPRNLAVDEEWYLRSYPDAAEAVRKGRFESGQEHFDLYGFKEGRLPYENWEL
jgi:hypothetical protein